MAIDHKVLALKEMLKTFDVPAQRLINEDWRWMDRNIHINNADNPNLDRVLELIHNVLRSK